MAGADSNLQQPLLAESEEQSLKYLDFVQVATIHALMFAARLYSYAKENSGPLKPSVDTVEDTVKNVVGPVYNKYQGVPVDVLKFADRKVDESVTVVQSRVSPTLLETAQNAPATARAVGVVGTASGIAKTVYAKYEPAAKDLITKYEPVAEQYATSAWRSLHKLPLFPRAVAAVTPTASYCSDKYNQTVTEAAGKWYRVAHHLPLVPTERIAKVLSA